MYDIALASWIWQRNFHKLWGNDDITKPVWASKAKVFGLCEFILQRSLVKQALKTRHMSVSGHFIQSYFYNYYSSASKLLLTESKYLFHNSDYTRLIIKTSNKKLQNIRVTKSSVIITWLPWILLSSILQYSVSYYKPNLMEIGLVLYKLMANSQATERRCFVSFSVSCWNREKQ